MAHRGARIATVAIALSTFGSVLIAQHGDAAHRATLEAQVSTTSSTGAWWGIDTVDNVQTSNILAQTTSELGSPQFVGRYLIYSSKISSTEAQYIHGQGLSILLIDDPNRAFSSGTVDAQQAIAQAHTLAVPQGIAIFRDVETSDPISPTYITAYVAAFAGSGYIPGFYENPINGLFADAYCGLVAANPAAVRGALLYSSEPERTGSDPHRALRPRYQPDQPGCANHTAGWQYLERGLFPSGTFPNVDVDELPARFSHVLWS
jgi:Domain of unknown function (DUF1906)